VAQIEIHLRKRLCTLRKPLYHLRKEFYTMRKPIFNDKRGSPHEVKTFSIERLYFVRTSAFIPLIVISLNFQSARRRR
ncbi:MAG TPA: hypothetical protein VF596_17845, partial [Pyrinomonadaceae bacterium]